MNEPRDDELEIARAEVTRLREAYRLLEDALRLADHRGLAAAAARCRGEDPPPV